MTRSRWNERDEERHQQQMAEMDRDYERPFMGGQVVNYDPVTLEETLHESLETALVQIVEFAGRTAAALNGVSPEQAQRDIQGMVRRWLTQAKANAVHGAYKPSLKSCGG